MDSIKLCKETLNGLKV